MSVKEDDRLGKIGARGLVVHEGKEVRSGYRYFSDNESETWRNFGVDLSKFADARRFSEADVKTLVTGRAPIAVVPPADGRPVGEPTILVNLEVFQGLGDAGERRPVVPAAKLAASSLDVMAFLIHEDGAYYAVARSQLKALAAMDEGDARVLVKRGAVAAAIPENTLPIGTHCVLVNLSQLLPE